MRDQELDRLRRSQELARPEWNPEMGHPVTVHEMIPHNTPKVFHEAWAGFSLSAA